jgi:hypothetical protein
MFWDITSVKQVASIALFATWFTPGFLLVLFLNPEAGGHLFRRKVSWLAINYMALCPRRYHATGSPLWEPEILHFDFYWDKYLRTTVTNQNCIHKKIIANYIWRKIDTVQLETLSSCVFITWTKMKYSRWYYVLFYMNLQCRPTH